MITIPDRPVNQSTVASDRKVALLTVWNRAGGRHV
jgi:hypothetical protein